MSLVAYASSSSSSASDPEETSSVNPKKRPPKCSRPPSSSGASSDLLPPPPASFANLYTSTPRASTGDDPALHGGRQRSVPHAAGTWPSHVYVEWMPSGDARRSLTSLIATSSRSHHGVHSLLRSPLGAPAPLHISLSRTLPVPTDHRERLLADLRSSLAPIQASEATIASPRWVLNGERTRWFLVLAAADTSSALDDMLSRCNDVVRGWGMPPLYSRDHDSGDAPEEFGGRAHVSIAWALAADQTTSASDRAALSSTGSVDGEQVQSKDHHDDDLRVPLTAVKVKIGNAVTEIPLAGAPGGRSRSGEEGWRDAEEIDEAEESEGRSRVGAAKRRRT